MTNTDKIVKIAQKISEKPEKCKVDGRAILEKLENPVPINVQYIECALKECLK